MRVEQIQVDDPGVVGRDKVSLERDDGWALVKTVSIVVGVGGTWVRILSGGCCTIVCECAQEHNVGPARVGASCEIEHLHLLH